MKDLLEILLDKNLKLISSDIRNMYSNVLIRKLLEIMGLMCNQNGINKELKYATTKFCKILTKQNYFQYIQEDGLAMGTPTSSVFLEIYLQYFENTKIFDILVKHHIIGYFQYVEDILIVHKNNATNIH